MKPRDLPQEECAAILGRSRYGRLALCQDGWPYVVPMSYVYYRGVIYLHSRPGGQKLELARANPRVVFQVDALEENRWVSVMARCRVTLDQSEEAKLRMFEAFTSVGMGGHGGKAFKREDMIRMPMVVWELNVEEMTGKEGIW